MLKQVETNISSIKKHRSIDGKAALDYWADALDGKTEYEKARAKNEYRKMSDLLNEVSNTPPSKWPGH